MLVVGLILVAVGMVLVLANLGRWLVAGMRSGHPLNALAWESLSGRTPMWAVVGLCFLAVGAALAAA